MKVFWSWQSDTPGKIGRHLVRDAIKDAIAVLKQPQDIEEPWEREARESLDIDHDRKGVSGTPDLAPTILEKITKAAVFVGDVTLVGEIPSSDDGTKKKGKKLINSNVAIEYGFALSALSYNRVLIVQNIHFGDREELPFDLRVKAGPIQFNVSPSTPKDEIARVRHQLKGDLVVALRECLVHAASALAPPFPETPSTTNRAYFWRPGDVLATYETALASMFRSELDDSIRYTFNEPRALYLRLIPTAALPQELSIKTLLEIARSKASAMAISRTGHATFASRNAYGVAACQPYANDTVPMVLTQLFPNGEVWSVSREMAIPYDGEEVLPIGNLTNSFSKTLRGIAGLIPDLGLSPPFKIELGAMGLRGLRLTLPSNPYVSSGQIFQEAAHMVRVVEGLTDAIIKAIVDDFTHKLCDLAGV